MPDVVLITAWNCYLNKKPVRFIAIHHLELSTAVRFVRIRQVCVSVTKSCPFVHEPRLSLAHSCRDYRLLRARLGGFFAKFSCQIELLF